MPWNSALRLCGALLSLFAISSAAHADVDAFNTYVTAPFVIDDQQGLAPILVDRLNAHLPAHFELKLNNVPRKRFTTTVLAEPGRFDGVALFLAPDFVGDHDQTHFLWSKPLFMDCNLIVSSMQAPLDYLRPDQFAGLHFGGVPDHHYMQIDEMAAAGKLTREDAPDEGANLKKVAARHLDFTVMPFTVYRYTSKALNLGPHLHVSPKPLDCFARRILIGRRNQPLLKAINDAIDLLQPDAQWNKAIAHYHPEPGMLPGGS
ncbi:MAG: hypothetical protein JO142_06005 [Burkholderiales bacterium]|nr:hypothetical protein [Burkholderiales bacterium]